MPPELLRIFPFIVGAGFLVAAFVLIRVPPERLLEFDRRTGRALADRAETREEGVRRAGVFYKVLGGIMGVAGLIALGVGVVLAVTG